MKRIVLVSILITLVVNVFSQETKNDTIVIANGNNVEVLINNNKVKIVDSFNGLKINVYSVTEDGEFEKNPYYESRYENNIVSKTERRNVAINIPINPTFIKDDSDSEDDKTPQLKFRYFEPIYPTIYYAYSTLAQTNRLVIIPLMSNSFEWGSYFSQFKLYHNKKNTFGLTSALGISNTYNYLNCVLGTHNHPGTNSNNCTYFYYGSDMEEAPDGWGNVMDGRVKKSYLRYWSLRMPISVQLKWRVGNNAMAFSFGPEFEWRFAMKSKVKFEKGGKYTVSDNIAYNPFGVNALAVFSFRDFVIFGRAGLIDLFNRNNSHEHFVPVNLGIGFSF